MFSLYLFFFTPPDLSEPCEPDAGWALTVTGNKSYVQS